jgi:hypothetical protein
MHSCVIGSTGTGKTDYVLSQKEAVFPRNRPSDPARCGLFITRVAEGPQTVKPEETGAGGPALS